MTDKDGYRRYLDAAAVLGQVTRARAEEIVRELMGGAEVPRAQAQQWVDDVVERGKRATEDLVEIVRSEVSNQLGALGLDPDDLARQAADILKRSAEAGRRAVADAGRSATHSGRSSHRRTRAGGPSGSAGKESQGHRGARPRMAERPGAQARADTPTKKTAAAEAPSAKAPVKKAPVKKAPVKKASVKKAPAKRQPAAAASPEKTPSKKVTAKKAPAKKPGSSPSSSARSS